MSEGFAGVVLIEVVKNRVGFITEGPAVDRLEFKMEVIQEKTDADSGTQGLGPHLRRGTQDQSRAVHRAPLFNLTSTRT